jgi:hypothetical protein
VHGIFILVWNVDMVIDLFCDSGDDLSTNVRFFPAASFLVLFRFSGYSSDFHVTGITNPNDELARSDFLCLEVRGLATSQTHK